jgi:hypothetical protein
MAASIMDPMTPPAFGYLPSFAGEEVGLSRRFAAGQAIPPIARSSPKAAP